MNAPERAQRAVAVKALLADQNIKDAFAAIEADLVAEWKATRVQAERENIWLAMNVIERLKVWMQSAASHDLQALRRVK